MNGTLTIHEKSNQRHPVQAGWQDLIASKQTWPCCKTRAGLGNDESSRRLASAERWTKVQESDRRYGEMAKRKFLDAVAVVVRKSRQSYGVK